jgi:hypothetical protein
VHGIEIADLVTGIIEIKEPFLSGHVLHLDKALRAMKAEEPLYTHLGVSRNYLILL